MGHTELVLPAKLRWFQEALRRPRGSGQADAEQLLIYLLFPDNLDDYLHLLHPDSSLPQMQLRGEKDSDICPDMKSVVTDGPCDLVLPKSSVIDPVTSGFKSLDAAYECEQCQKGIKPGTFVFGPPYTYSRSKDHYPRLVTIFNIEAKEFQYKVACSPECRDDIWRNLADQLAEARARKLPSCSLIRNQSFFLPALSRKCLMGVRPNWMSTQVLQDYKFQRSLNSEPLQWLSLPAEREGVSALEELFLKSRVACPSPKGIS